MTARLPFARTRTAVNRTRPDVSCPAGSFAAGDTAHNALAATDRALPAGHAAWGRQAASRPGSIFVKPHRAVPLSYIGYNMEGLLLHCA